MSQEWKLVPVKLTEEMLESAGEYRLIVKCCWTGMLAAAPVPPEDDFKIACDFCATEVDYEPWHGSGLLNGVVSRHVHACNNCRALLPLPPAGGEVEVLGWRMDEASGDLNGFYREEPVWHYLGKPEDYKVTKLTDHSHVTRLQAENAALQQRLNVADQRVDELIGAIRTINRGKPYEVRVPGDDDPQYRQRKQWVDWILQLCDQATPQ